MTCNSRPLCQCAVCTQARADVHKAENRNREYIPARKRDVTDDNRNDKHSFPL